MIDKYDLGPLVIVSLPVVTLGFLYWLVGFEFAVLMGLAMLIGQQ